MFIIQIFSDLTHVLQVLPLHSKMRDKSAFIGWTGVLNLGLVITICLYQAVGFYSNYVYDCRYCLSTVRCESSQHL